MLRLRKITAIIFLSISVPFSALAQAAPDEIEMADLMRSSGKIYVVVAVLLIIFIGLAIYLINIDRKVSRLEKERRAK
jgi:CcmD family protein